MLVVNQALEGLTRGGAFFSAFSKYTSSFSVRRVKNLTVSFPTKPQQNRSCTAIVAELKYKHDSVVK